MCSALVRLGSGVRWRVEWLGFGLRLSGLSSSPLPLLLLLLLFAKTPIATKTRRRRSIPCPILEGIIRNQGREYR